MVESGRAVEELQPQLDAIVKCPGRGIIVSAIAPPGSGFDFCSRFFCPKYGVNEVRGWEFIFIRSGWQFSLWCSSKIALGSKHGWFKLVMNSSFWMQFWNCKILLLMPLLFFPFVCFTLQPSAFLADLWSSFTSHSNQFNVFNYIRKKIFNWRHIIFFYYLYLPCP